MRAALARILRAIAAELDPEPKTVERYHVHFDGATREQVERHLSAAVRTAQVRRG